MSVNNMIKILSYIYPISKQNIQYQKFKFSPVEHLYLRSTLFCKDECLICGKCCIAEENVYLPFEVEDMYECIRAKDIDTDVHKVNGKGYSNIEELIESLQPFYVTINDTEFKMFKSSLPPNIYTFEDRGTLKRCHWDLPTEDGRLGCGIHTVSSLTCKMPHIRFFFNSKTNSTSIGHSQYGRNWAMKCPANISKTEFSEASLDTAICNFKLLRKYCEYFKIDTWCDRIIELLEYVKENGYEYVDAVCDRDIVTDDNIYKRCLF